MTYFISYDIADAKRLRKVAKILEDYGWRIQFSFFQCEVEKERLDELLQKLLGIIDKKEDSVMVMPLCQDCTSPLYTLGTGSVYVQETFQIL